MRLLHSRGNVGVRGCGEFLNRRGARGLPAPGPLALSPDGPGHPGPGAAEDGCKHRGPAPRRTSTQERAGPQVAVRRALAAPVRLETRVGANVPWITGARRCATLLWFDLGHRNPMVTAKMLTTIDTLSKGRLICGVGVGWWAEEFAALGIPFKARGRLADESIKIF